MKVYAVSCDKGRADRLMSAAAPLGLDIVIVDSPLKDDPEVVGRGATCFARGTAYPTGLAATLGHLRAMARITDDYAIIIEDDVRFRKDFCEKLEIVMRHIDDADVFTLGFVNFPEGEWEDMEGLRVKRNVPLSNPWGAQCYVIRKEYAHHLVNLFSIYDVSIPYQNHFVTDCVLFDPILGCRRHTLVDPIAAESPDEQTIAGSINKMPLFEFGLKIEDYCT